MAGISRIMAVENDGADGLRFTIGTLHGVALQSGAFPPTSADVGLIVLSDYALLRRPELLGYSRTGRIGLLLPAAEEHAERHPASALRRWEETPPQERVLLSASAIADVRPLLELRRRVEVEAEQSLERAEHLVSTMFPAYFDVLSHEGSLVPGALRFLLRYPTPRALTEESPLRLQGALEKAFPRGSQVRCTIADLQQAEAGAHHDGPEDEYASQVIRLAVQDHQLQLSQLGDIDLSIHRSAVLRSGAGKRTASRVDVTAQSIFRLPGSLPPQYAPNSLDAASRRLGEIAERALGSGRRPVPDFDEYLAARAVLERADPGESSAADAVERDVLGQRLALAAARLDTAMQYRAQLQRLLDAAPSGALSPAQRATAEANNAITGLIASNVATGFGTLRQLVQSEQLDELAPALRGEVLGLAALVVLMFGEVYEYEYVLAAARDVATAHALTGIGRAAIDVVDMFLAASPATDDAVLREAIQRADVHSTGTYVRPFFNLLMMSLCAVTKDHEAGLRHSRELLQFGVWEQYSPSLLAEAQLVRAMLLAGIGDFGTSHAELDRIRIPTEPIAAQIVTLQHRVFHRQLDLAAGETAAALRDTAPGGALDPQALTALRARRYLPAALVIRATALIRSGSAKSTDALYRRALEATVASREWHVLLAIETTEFRAWLTRLPDDQLPADMTPAMRARILDSPLYLPHRIPLLTAQQLRVLGLLSRGVTTDGIATQLHVSRNTLKTHMRRLYRRLGVGSRDDAVRRAREYGFLPR